MKRISFFKYAMLFVAAITLLGFNSCKDDEDDDDPDPIFVEDGLYVKGNGTTFTELDIKGMLTSTPNEAASNAARTGLLNIYVAVKAGAEGFNLVQVAGNQQTVWGPGATFDSVKVATRHQDEPRGIFWRGALATTATAFTVPEDGLYHVAVDLTLGTVALAKVEWGLIGGATPGGWGSNTVMTAPFNLDSMTFSVENVAVEVGEFKFRYSNGWKIFMDAPANTVSVNTNFGKAVNDLEPGGANIANTVRGKYKFTMKWKAGAAYKATMEKTGDLDPLPEYPATLYMIGNALNMADNDANGTPDGWQWELTDAQLIPVHSNPGLFWKIVWLEKNGNFKFAPEKKWAGDFGKTGDATNGIFDKGGSDVPVPGESGYYMVVVNLDEEKIAVVDPKVYLIGNAIDSWDTANAAGLFTVDNANSVITITKSLAATPELRMYAWFDAADWFTKARTGGGTQVSWWQVEFIILDGKIEYRGAGGDQARVAVDAANYTINLKFKDNTGTITKN